MSGSFTLSINNINRQCYFRQTSSAPKNAIIWVHPGIEASFITSTPGQQFVEKHIQPSPDRIDFGPSGLLNNRNPNKYVWATPGDTNASWAPIPTPDPLADRNFLDALCDYIPAHFPSVESIMYVGHSGGSLLGWELYGHNKVAGEQIKAYFLAAAGEPTVNNYDWTGLTKDPRHCCFWNGSLDNETQTEIGAKDWMASTIDLVHAAGYSNLIPPAAVGYCCGKELQKADYWSLPVKFRRLVLVGAGHPWIDCSGMDESETAIKFFKDCGAFI